MNTNCYVYKWTHLPTLNWYVGSRSQDKSHPGDGYICSSLIVKPMVLSKPWEWRREIIATGTKQEMRELEIEILQLFDARNDPKSFNRSNGAPDFFTQKGKIFKEYHRRNLSKAVRKMYERERELGIKRTAHPNCIEASRKANTGRPITEEAKRIIGEKNSKKLKGRKRDPLISKKAQATRIKNGTNIRTEETREKIRQAIKAKGPRPLEVIEKIKATKKQKGIKAVYYKPVETEGIIFKSVNEAAEYWAIKWDYSISHTKKLMAIKFKQDEQWIKLPKIKALESQKTLVVINNITTGEQNGKNNNIIRRRSNPSVKPNRRKL